MRDYKEYLLERALPVFWCTGCGNGIVLQAICRAFAEEDLDPKQIVVTTGIGCWGKADEYTKTNTLHGTHGRAMAFATGVKLANPNLHVVACMGDGDGATIGGNHLIHAARRNVDITAILVNNLNYGMTGGQYSGTTFEHMKTSTSAYGHIEPPFDICELVKAAGASYVARETVNSPIKVKNYIKKGLEKKGFSLIEVVSPCPTQYGRANNMKTAPEMMKWIKERTITVDQAKDLSEDEKRTKFIIGEYVNRDSVDYSTKYQMMSDSIAK